MKAAAEAIKKVTAEQQLIHKLEFGIRVREFLSHIQRVVAMVIKDLREPVDLSRQHGLRAWRRGFKRFNYRIYGLAQSGDPNDYLSDYQALKQMPINDRFSSVVNNKLMFPLLMKHHGMPTPEIHGVIRKGVFYPLHSGPVLQPEKFLRNACTVGERIVIKPLRGWHGTGIVMVEHTKRSYKVNGDSISPDVLSGVIGGLDNYVVTQYVKQGKHGARLYPRTTNTIRVVTFWDAEIGKSFIARAIQRIGTSQSFPVDNFKRAGRGGGVSALVESDNGELRQGAMVDIQGNVSWHSRHPESHAKIEGTVVPAWNKIHKSLLNYANKLAYIPCIGWDIVPTDAGFTIIEGNPNPGLPLMQIHGPMLTDPRVRQFYKNHALIS